MITLTKEEAQQVLDAMTRIRWAAGERDKKNRVRDFDEAMDVSGEAIETLRARLSAPEPEPVADKYLMEVECTKCGAKQDGILTVNAPPQREWQGLTDEEAAELCHAPIAVIEAKLKDKNSG